VLLQQSITPSTTITKKSSPNLLKAKENLGNYATRHATDCEGEEPVEIMPSVELNSKNETIGTRESKSPKMFAPYFQTLATEESAIEQRTVDHAHLGTRYLSPPAAIKYHLRDFPVLILAQ
jgi:hypothetical protein